jgi:hypothetical protein
MDQVSQIALARRRIAMAERHVASQRRRVLHRRHIQAEPAVSAALLRSSEQKLRSHRQQLARLLAEAKCAAASEVTSARAI